MKRRFCLAGLLVLAAGGCGTKRSRINERMSTYIGNTEAELISRLGTPTRSYAMPDGSRSLQYERIETRASKLTGLPGTVRCTQDFVISSDGIVTSSRYDGNGCR